MSNHLHLILQSKTLPLSDIIRDFKKFTANSIIDYIEDGFNESRKEWILNRFQFNASKHQRNSKYQVWTHDNHAEELLSTKFIQQKLDYIHQNRVWAGIVQNDYEYLYSSARNYAGLSYEPIAIGLVYVFKLKLLNKYKPLSIEIDGFTDSRGTKEYNQQLSMERAHAVVKYLIDNGIDQARLAHQGFGETKPDAPNEDEEGKDNPEGRQLNRRVESMIVDLK